MAPDLPAGVIFMLPVDERSRASLARAVCRAAWRRGLNISHRPDAAGLAFRVSGEKVSVARFVSRILTVFGN